jgi:hypothetical protein
VSDQPQNAGSGEQVSRLLRLVTTVGSPIALATALLVYFGWVRGSVQARELGYDVSVESLSTREFVLRSVDVLFLPLVLLLLVGLLLRALHTRAVRADRPERTGAIQVVARALRWSWPFWLLLAVLGLATDGVRPVALPLALTLALLSVLYGELLDRRVGGPSASRTRERQLERRIIVLVLLALVLFWDTERLARAVGEAFAEDIGANPDQLVWVTVYSGKDLQLELPGVEETRLSGTDSAYVFRYDGLRLLSKSGEKYVVINRGWDRRTGRVVLIRDDASTRMEFARPVDD